LNIGTGPKETVPEKYPPPPAKKRVEVSFKERGPANATISIELFPLLIPETMLTAPTEE
jgi:hypothetical protein